MAFCKNKDSCLLFSSVFYIKDLLYLSNGEFSELRVAEHPEDRKKRCQNKRNDVINDEIGRDDSFADVSPEQCDEEGFPIQL